jgi:uncharacterized repeat protein (TIGR02543 family)
MVLRKILYLFIVITAIGIIHFFQCAIPNDPNDASNTRATLVLINSELEESSSSITDSIGRYLKIGVFIKLPQYIDSIGLKIVSDDGAQIDTLFSDLAPGGTDTLWKKASFTTPGTKTVTITPYSSLDLQPLVGVIKIVGEPLLVSNDHFPKITYTGNRFIRPLETCTLIVKASDEDSGQTVTLSMNQHPNDAAFSDETLFVWTAPESASGEYEVSFSATDDGVPPKTDSLKVLVDVSTDTANRAPVWNQDTITDSINENETYTLQLTEQCTDPDGDTLTYLLLSGEPDGDTIEESIYTLSGTEDLLGEHFITIVVNDQDDAADTMVISLIITADTATANRAPEWTQDTIIDTINDNVTYTLQLSEQCTDPDGDALTYLLLSGEPEGDTIEDAIYTLTGTEDLLGEHFITIVANDQDDAADTVIIKLTVTLSAVAGTMLDTLELSVGTLTQIVHPIPDTIRDTVSYIDSSLSVSLTTRDSRAKVTVNDEAGTPAEPFQLEVGATVITISVTDSAETVKKAYTLIVVRKPATTIELTTPLEGVDASTVSATAIRIIWDDLFGAYSYSVERSTEETDGFREIGTATGNALTDTGLTEATTYYYRVSASNSTSTSDFSAVVSATTWRRPSVDTPLQPVTVAVGQKVSLTVSASGTAPLSYQWQKDGDAIDGETNATLIITGADLADDGSYRVVVTNSVGSTNSNQVKVTVQPVYTLSVNKTADGGTVTVQKDSAVYITGTSVSLTAAPKSGYRFTGWSGDTTATVNPLTVTMMKNRNITAVYQKTYVLTLVSSDASRGSVALTQGISPITVDSGATIGISATASSGFKFKQWSTTAAGVTITAPTVKSTSVILRGGNAMVTGEFGCYTFAKQLSFGQYSDMSLSDAVQIADGSYFVIGSYENNLVLIKLNQTGDTIWTKTDNTLTFGNSIRKCSSGYLVSGSYNSNTAAVYCFAQNGNIIWSYLFGNAMYSSVASITTETKNGGYIVGGNDGGSYLMIGLNSIHATVWDTAINVSGGGVADCIEARDGGYVFVGVGTAGLARKAVKVNSSGNVEWNSDFSSSLSSVAPSSFSSIDTMENGGYIIAGKGNLNGESRGFIVKVVPDGTDGEGILVKDASQLNGIRRMSNGEFLIAGGTLTLGTGGLQDIYIARINTEGSVLGTSTFGGTENENARSLQLTDDGGAIIVGTSCWIIKTDENGYVD